MKYFNFEGERYRTLIVGKDIRWVEVFANGEWHRMVPTEFMSPWFRDLVFNAKGDDNAEHSTTSE